MDNNFDCDSDLELSDDFKLEAMFFGLGPEQNAEADPPVVNELVEPNSPVALPSPPCIASPPPSSPPLSFLLDQLESPHDVQVDYDYNAENDTNHNNHLDGQVSVIPAHPPPDHHGAAVEAVEGEVAQVEPPSADSAPTSAEVETQPAQIEFSDSEVLGYSGPTLGEKGKIGWCCFYALSPDHAEHLELYRLRLVDRRKGRVKWEMPAVPKLSWAVRGNGLSRRVRQVKLAFQLPDTTFARRIFRAELVRAATSETPSMSLQLGGVSLVSTTSQRTEKWYAQINKHFPDEAHRAMAHNYRHQPRFDRHFENNKGAHQATLQPGEFRDRELEKAVPLRVTYTLDPTNF
jgi:hypothetical protein